MPSVDVVRGRGGRLIFPAEYAYLLDEANAQLTKIAREIEKPGRPFVAPGGGEA